MPCCRRSALSRQRYRRRSAPSTPAARACRLGCHPRPLATRAAPSPATAPAAAALRADPGITPPAGDLSAGRQPASTTEVCGMMD